VPFRTHGGRWLSDRTDPPVDPPTDEAATDATTAEEVEAEPVAAPSREEQLEAQVQQLKDQLLRSLAEQENTRSIAKRDVENGKLYAIKSFAKSLLDVSDNLTRAMEAVPEDARVDQQESNHVLHNLYEGIAMTERGLLKAFESNGLVKFGQAGEAFDPNRHEALYEYVDPDKEPGTVGQVVKDGFLLNKRVLRPAEVGIVKKE
jgi:molecular chaperone GrpE